MKRRKRTWNEIANQEPDLQWGDPAKAAELERRLIWKGYPQATLVQRIVIVIFSIVPFSLAASLVNAAFQIYQPDEPVFALAFLLLAAPFAYAGCRILRNAFLRPSSKSDHL